MKKRSNISNKIYTERNSKDNIINDLQKKINLQQEQISQLLEYKSLYENKIKENDSSTKFPLKLEKDEKSLNDLLIGKKPNYKNNRNKTARINKTKSDMNIHKSTYSQNDKYNLLYHKYIKLLQDYKELSNNSTYTNTEYTKMKTQYNEIKEQNSLLLKQINKKENENEKIKELTQQVQTFREELVLSQALVNSLKAELENMSKNKNNFNTNESVFDNEKIKMTLKKNNMLLSNILQENNELRKKANNYSTNNNNDFLNNDLLINLQNNLSAYENKFDYFNDYINNIKNKISIIFNDLKNIVNENEKNENFLKDLKIEINNLNSIDRYNLDSIDDEKCLESYMNLVKFLLNNFKNSNDKKIINKQDNIFNKTKNQIIDLQNIIKLKEDIQKSNKGGLKRLISDALNIIINLSNLYKIQNTKSENRNNINEKIIKMENEFDYIKKIISNYKTKNIGKKLTYTLSYNSQRFNTINRDSNNIYFKYK